MATTKIETMGTLNVTGESDLKVAPDMASFQVGVSTNAQSARDAVAQNAARMTQVVNALKALGVPAEDLQTSGFSVAPVTDNDPHSPTYGQIVGYQATDMLMVRLDPALAGQAIDASARAGANLAGQLSFELRDATAMHTQAQQSALKAAMHDAAALARTMGATVTGVRSADVYYGGTSRLGVATPASVPAGTPVQPGMLSVTARATVVFNILMKGMPA
jgi:uncharacterized protein